jgi:hypothetical protein
LIKELGTGNYERDQKVYLDFDPGMINVFDKASGSLIKYAV